MRLDERKIQRHLRPSRAIANVAMLLGALVLFVAPFLKPVPKWHKHTVFNHSCPGHELWTFEECSDERCNLFEGPKLCGCGVEHSSQ